MFKLVRTIIETRSLLLTTTLFLLASCGGSGSSGNSDISGSSSTSTSSSNSSSSSSGGSETVKVFFDDFSYIDSLLMTQNVWYVRSGGGGPGITGATWSTDLVTFHDDPSLTSNSLMKLQAVTSGPNGDTVQSQVTTDGSFLKGTYAARVKFTNGPTSGPDGDEIVETFYTITPLDFDLDPDYSEIDFEYLPNGGWGHNTNTMFMTTWETYSPDPWQAINVHDSSEGDYTGWKTLIVQVDDTEVRYYIDGVLQGTHSDIYYPETAMSINFNLWFINNGLVDSSTARTYEQDVDWVLFVEDAIWNQTEILGRIDQFRADEIDFSDTTTQ
jgi:endo-1,3-1,4-beta-glycanase ExoK